MKSSTTALYLLLILIGGGLYFVLSDHTGESMAPAPIELDPPATADAQPKREFIPTQDLETPDKDTDEAADPSGRSQVTSPQRSNGADYAQGAMGQVTDMAGQPQSGIRVYLVEAVSNPIVAIQQKQRGRIVPHLAEDRTGDDGRFALGVLNLRAEKLYDLYFVDEHNRFIDKTIPNVTLKQEEWYESNRVRLHYGQLIHGMVRSQIYGGQGIEGAIVTIRNTDNMMSLTPIPNREDGLTAITDSKGYYQFRNAPSRGFIMITAVAEEHAMIAKPRIKITKGKENNIDFDLPSGLTITGIVTDSEGEPIASAVVRTRALSAKTLVGDDTRTDNQGAFELIGLAEGPYNLTVLSPNYGMYNLKGIEAGSTDHHVVLESKGSARLRVLGANGRAMATFQAQLKRSSPKADGALSSLADQALVTVTARDLEKGFYILGGIDTGTYAFEVHANHYAKTYSEPFEVEIGKPPPEVEVRIQRGGSLVGRIVDPEGRGINGAMITTLPIGYQENAITAMFGTLIQTTITRKFTKSTSGGNFTLDTLAPGTYQLKVEHADFIWQFLSGYEVLPNRKHKISAITLSKGCSVTGRTMVNGQPAAQIKVQIFARGEDDKLSDTPFSATAVTDMNGFFSIERRLHPGKYQASAAQATSDNIFAAFSDEQQTRREFDVAPGQAQLRLDFHITRNR